MLPRAASRRSLSRLGSGRSRRQHGHGRRSMTTAMARPRSAGRYPVSDAAPRTRRAAQPGLPAGQRHGLRRGPVQAEAAADDLLHDLGSAAEDGLNPTVGPGPLQSVLAHVAAAAVQLDAAVGDSVAQLGVPPLDHADIVADTAKHRSVMVWAIRFGWFSWMLRFLAGVRTWSARVSRSSSNMASACCQDCRAASAWPVVLWACPSWKRMPASVRRSPIWRKIACACW